MLEDKLKKNRHFLLAFILKKIAHTFVEKTNTLHARIKIVFVSTIIYIYIYIKDF